MNTTQQLAYSFRTLLPAIREAGRIAMAIYDREFAVEVKGDMSPVTEADLAVDAYLSAQLAVIFPGIPVITEEQSKSHDADVARGAFLLVDPIDGTKEFIRKSGEFTINVAMVQNGVPVAGIVQAPALDRLYLGIVGQGAWEVSATGDEAPLAVRMCDDGNIVAVASRSHLTEATARFLDENTVNQTRNAGSSLKFCLLAAGDADVYPRYGPTMEWDTAAGHAVLAAAGGRVRLPDGSDLSYGKPGFRNPDFIACSGRVDYTCPKLEPKAE